MSKVVSILLILTTKIKIIYRFSIEAVCNEDGYKSTEERKAKRDKPLHMSANEIIVLTPADFRLG